MFLQRFVSFGSSKKERRFKTRVSDSVTDQLKEALQKSDQKIILMVRN